MSASSTAPLTKRTRRPSKFIEGAPATSADLLQQTPTANEHFFNILSEMDEFEKKRQHRGSQSSFDSIISSSGSPVKDKRSTPDREGRRSTGVAGRPSAEAVREFSDEKKSHKFVGRLRGLTIGKDKEEKRNVYPGT